jgi:hypothetical protein
MRALVLIGIVLIALGLALIPLGCKGIMVSDGYREGIVQKFGDKGIIFTTHEGELASKGWKATTEGGTYSAWEFSVWDSKVDATLRSLPIDCPVRLHYRKHRWVWPYQGSTSYEVYKVVLPAARSKAEDGQ